MNKVGQFHEFLKRAAELNLWLSYREMGLALGISATYCGILASTIRKRGALINSRGEARSFEYMLAEN